MAAAHSSCFNGTTAAPSQYGIIRNILRKSRKFAASEKRVSSTVRVLPLLMKGQGGYLDKEKRLLHNATTYFLRLLFNVIISIHAV